MRVSTFLFYPGRAGYENDERNLALIAAENGGESKVCLWPTCTAVTVNNWTGDLRACKAFPRTEFQKVFTPAKLLGLRILSGQCC